ncbi:PqqD family protein [Bacillus thuringiensis]
MMKKYEYIETGSTAIVDIEGIDPIFLNETAASIIKMHIDGITLEEIKNKLMNEYAIPDKDIKNFENQVESTISNFENTLNNGE